MTGPVPTVFVVDDDESFRAAVTRLLRASGHTVETFGSGAEFLDRLRRDAAGCVLMDLRLPGMNGLDLQDALARAGTPLPVVFLTGHGDVPASVRALKHGAEDFLAKRAPKAELLDAVARALARGARERSEGERRRAALALYARLTPREREVLAQVLRGRLNKEIAWALSIHERTVKLHRTSITTKLGVTSVAGLTRWVQEAGLMPQLEALAEATRPKGY